jgi:hypothetical protein
MAIVKCKLTDLQDKLWPRIDVLICCASFESRCRSVADIIEPELIKHALIAENKNLSHYVGENADYLRNRFENCAKDVHIDSTDPLRTADNLDSALKSISIDSQLRYLVDITTFTHESLLILFKLLYLRKKPKDKVTFVYTGASDYSTTEETRDKWLSKGVSDIRSVLGYPGEVLPSRKDHLIILVGYEHQRASKLIENFEPDIISLGYGKPGSETDKKHREANLHFKDLVAKAAVTYGKIEEFEFSCNDPWDAKQAILKCVQLTLDYNHIVAPMNTKISTIGSALAAIEYESIQLCYAQPLQYNYRSYSTPGNTCYLLQSLVNYRT